MTILGGVRLTSFFQLPHFENGTRISLKKTKLETHLVKNAVRQKLAFMKPKPFRRERDVQPTVSPIDSSSNPSTKAIIRSNHGCGTVDSVGMHQLRLCGSASIGQALQEVGHRQQRIHFAGGVHAAAGIKIKSNSAQGY